MFRVSLGGVNPRPRTLLGTMAHAAPPAAALARKTRREISLFLLMSISPRLHYRAVAEILRRQALAQQAAPLQRREQLAAGYFAEGRIRKRAGARRRRRRRARERCQRDRGGLLRRDGRP